jgi:hypothetical protein
VDKYLEPISGVLETVLTSGGKEIFGEIDHIAKSLCLKSSPCYHLHLLKLLKVLFLDSKQQSSKDSNQSADFAKQFLAGKGL